MDKSSSEAGATMLEYCFIALLLLVLCVAGIGSIGVATSDKLKDPELASAFGTVPPAP